MVTDISRMVPFWSKLSPARQDVLTATAAALGVWKFLGLPTLHAAADRGNVESVCRILQGKIPDELIEQYRRG